MLRAGPSRRLPPPVGELAFELVYDGPSLEAGEMDARDFARAVLSASDLFQQLHEAAFPADPRMAVNVTALAPGSFHVLLKLLFSDAETGLTSTPAIALANLTALVQGLGGLLRRARIRGRGEQLVEENRDGTIHYRTADGAEFQIPAAFLRASERVSVRRNVTEIIQPLDAQGVQSLTIKQEDTVIERIEKGDVAAIRQGQAPEVPAVPDLPPTDRETWLVLQAVTFKEGNQWRFTEGDGEHPFGAKITDPSFLAQIDDGEPFRKNDRLRVILRQTQTTEPGGSIKTDREIIRVLDHVPTGVQTRFRDV